jgi:hypothetical protein
MTSFTIFIFLKYYCDRNVDDELSRACRTQTRNSYILIGKTEVNSSMEYVVMAQFRIGGYV